MKKSLGIILTLGVMAISITVNAQTRRLQIPMYGEHMRGQNTIFLKQQIKDLYPRINLRTSQLKKVILVAKSKHGNGTVALKVGHNTGRDFVVDGAAYDFHYPGNFSRVPIRNHFGSRGVWQLKLQGNFKIKKVVVVLDTQRRPRPIPTVTRSCSYELKIRFGGRHIKTFRANASGMRGTGVAQKACRKAKHKCEDYKDNFGNLGSLGRCSRI